jgi:hypothetical protein
MNFVSTEHSITKITKKNERKPEQSCQVQKHKTENNYPQKPCGKKLPKYGSQSETTIDSCP